MRMIQSHSPPRYAEHLEAFLAEAVVQGLDRCPRFVVQWLKALLFAQSILRGQPEDIFGRALDHEQPFLALIDQHRNAPPFEVERHLVDLAPAACVYLLVLKDRVIQRTLQSGLE